MRGQKEKEQIKLKLMQWNGIKAKSMLKQTF